LQSSIGAFFIEETKTVNFYSTLSSGQWQNPQNVQGPPDVGPTDDINSFSETNSAIYKSGPLHLISENFTTDENFSNYNFQLAQIRFSFAFGEKKPDFQIFEKEAPTTSESGPTSILIKIKNFFTYLFNRVTLIAKAQENNTTTEVIEATSTEATATETTTSEITTTTATSAETLPNLDTRIIIWWSLDGQNWQILDNISNYPLSNALNGGYFEYDAPFLSNWDDFKNLKIKFEGVVGGETNVVAYLDSVWVEVTYLEQVSGEKEGFELRALKKDWRADETPTFEIVEKGKKAEENIVEKIIDKVSSIFEEQSTIEAKLDRPDDEELLLREGKDFTAETHSPTKISILKPEDFRPGLYNLKIDFEKNGKIYNLEQDFSWGVLAINVNKSIYLSAEASAKAGLPNEQAYLQMAVLDERGHTVCDADLTLEITAPDGTKTVLATSNKQQETSEQQQEATTTEATSTEATSTEATSTEATSTFATSTQTEGEATSTQATSTPPESPSPENFGETGTSTFSTTTQTGEETTSTEATSTEENEATSFLYKIKNSFFGNLANQIRERFVYLKLTFREFITALTVRAEEGQNEIPSTSTVDTVTSSDEVSFEGVTSTDVTPTDATSTESTFVATTTQATTTETTTTEAIPSKTIILESTTTIQATSSEVATTTEEATTVETESLPAGKIYRSQECGPNSVTYTPDYYTYYNVSGSGIYQIKLTAITKNGTYEITDSFEVRESVPFDVERIGPTRIYPPAAYEMTLRIKVNQDFVGQVVEQVPLGFRIENIEYRANGEPLNSNPNILNSSDVQEIHWQVDWKAGKSYELKYQFDAPDISPYLYLLGPLRFEQ